MSQVSTVLKTPWPVKALSLSFLVAPFGNILISIINSTVPNWYQPQMFLMMVQSIPLFEWLWLSAIFACGVLLMIRHKLAWSFAVSTLIFVLGVNIYKFQSAANDLSHRMIPTEYQLGISLLVTAAALMIVFYARYPYLDRRDSWFGKAARRFDVDLKAQVLAPKECEARVLSLSTTGARLELNEDLKLPAMQEIDLLLPDSPLEQLKSRVVLCEGRTLRLKFLSLSKADRKKLLAWLEKNALEKGEAGSRSQSRDKTENKEIAS